MKKLRQTSPNKWVGIIRTMLGLIFLMTGIMKLTFAEFARMPALPTEQAGRKLVIEMKNKIKKKKSNHY